MIVNRDTQRLAEWFKRQDWDFEADDAPLCGEDIYQFLLDSGCSPEDSGISCDTDFVNWEYVFNCWMEKEDGRES